MNMAGVAARYPGSIPQHVSPVFSWTYMQIGDVQREGPGIRCEEEGDPFAGPYRLTAYDGDLLIGANLINNPKDLAWIKKELNNALSVPCI